MPPYTGHGLTADVYAVPHDIVRVWIATNEPVNSGLTAAEARTLARWLLDAAAECDDTNDPPPAGVTPPPVDRRHDALWSARRQPTGPPPLATCTACGTAFAAWADVDRHLVDGCPPAAS